MIQLHPDYLIFQTSQGELIPCSAESVTIELIGEASSEIDPGLVREAAAAVVHYFREELGQETVSVAEFSRALEKVLNNFGFEVTASTSYTDPARETKMSVSDIEAIARESGDFELGFFQNLRLEFTKQLQNAPDVVSFCHLRQGVKSLVGAKRWCNRCEQMSDQIVLFLRECLSARAGGEAPALVVK